MDDLVVVTPDAAYPLVLEEFFKRHQSMGIRHISRRIIKDPLRDSSGQLPELLRPFLRHSQRALAIRDLAGSGWEDRGPAALEEWLLRQMRANGWAEGSCAAIVVDPEIEIWLRLPSEGVDELIQERARRNRLLTPAQRRQRLGEIVARLGGYTENRKPTQPKEAFAEFLRVFGMPRSNALYRWLAAEEPLEHCVTPSFLRLRDLLRSWFPVR
jgi:hypothetical protein